MINLQPEKHLVRYIMAISNSQSVKTRLMPKSIVFYILLLAQQYCLVLNYSILGLNIIYFVIGLQEKRLYVTTILNNT